jgi:hypothetical protein
MVAAAVALNFAVVPPAVIVTDVGTVSEALLLASVMPEPPVGAAWERVTVQELTAPALRLAGLHVMAETRTGANRLKVAVFELLPLAAVTVAV